MEMGKLTAKLRDAVPVCFLVEGKEIKRYKNIEIPDELKALEYKDFKFDVPLIGAITFTIMFGPGVLPDVFPQARERKTRKPVGEASAPLADTVAGVQEESQHVEAISETVVNDAPIELEEMGEGHSDAFSTPDEPATMELSYHVTGERRKELVKAIGQFTGMAATYRNVPTFAFAIGNYIVDKSGTLTGAYDASMVEALAEKSFIAE